MFKRLLCAAAVVFCFFSTPADAFTGNDIHGICQIDEKDQLCQAVVVTFNKALSLFYAASGCVPGEVKLSQTRELFVRDIMRNPETRHKEAWVLYQASMKRAFGCGDVLSKALNAVAN